MAQYSATASRKIIYRAVAKGTMVLETPAHFGTGEQTGTELTILQDVRDGSPLLPGASQAGAFRHYLLRREKGYRTADDSAQKDTRKNRTVATQLFGEALDQNRFEQSRVIIHDARGIAGGLSIRDGVKIVPADRTADDGALFNVQVWDEGTKFELRLELYICGRDENQPADDADKLKQGFAVILKALQDGEIPLGARKHRGYGRGKVTDWKVYEYDLTQIEDFLNWVKGAETADTAYEFLNRAESFHDERERVKLEATFALCDSLMIRAAADLVDNTHLTNSKGQPLLSGTSITGALRARALKIAKTLKDHPEAEALVDDMFGLHGNLHGNKATDEKTLTASRIHVQETTVENAEMNLIQNRVKLDRFTGGAYETALISEQPAFARPETQVTIRLELQYPSSEADRQQLDQQTGLLLLLLKDLWSQDLPLGGESSIGRGRLKGLNATLEIGRAKTPVVYIFDQRGLVNSTPEQVRKLQAYVNALWGKLS